MTSAASVKLLGQSVHHNVHTTVSLLDLIPVISQCHFHADSSKYIVLPFCICYISVHGAPHTTLPCDIDCTTAWSVATSINVLHHSCGRCCSWVMFCFMYLNYVGGFFPPFCSQISKPESTFELYLRWNGKPSKCRAYHLYFTTLVAASKGHS